MKVTTLPKVLSSLQRMEHRITVPAPIAARARRAIERMVSIGGQTPLSTVPDASQDPGE
jgi:quinolinate synthase